MVVPRLNGVWTTVVRTCHNEVQVTICKHTDHLYVCMLLTVRQANEAKI